MRPLILLCASVVAATAVGIGCSHPLSSDGSSTDSSGQPPRTDSAPAPSASDSTGGDNGSSGSSGQAPPPGSSGGAADAGTPSGSASACTNGVNITLNLEDMDPGYACNNCHTTFGPAGTLYPTAHEIAGCKGVDGTTGTYAGVTVVATDAQNVDHTLDVNASGNFYSTTKLAEPYKVKVVGKTGAVRAMATPITGSMNNCNSCHDQQGTGQPAAPGRVLVP